jgi:hypothetical protein
MEDENHYIIRKRIFIIDKRSSSLASRKEGAGKGDIIIISDNYLELFATKASNIKVMSELTDGV